MMPSSDPHPADSAANSSDDSSIMEIDIEQVEESDPLAGSPSYKSTNGVAEREALQLLEVTTSPQENDAPQTPENGVKIRLPAKRSSPRKGAQKKAGIYTMTDDFEIISVDDDLDYLDDDEAFRAKRSKTQSPSSNNCPLTSGTTDPTRKCRHCRQRLVGIQVCPKFPPAAASTSEEEALRHPNIYVEGASGTEDKHQALITHYALHDREGHLVNLTWGLVEEGKTVYFSGYVKGVFDGDPNTTENGVAVARGGPVTQFWSTGYEEGEQHVIGISTDRADYYLKKPCDEYWPLIQELDERTVSVK
jgi:hypothetical protein